MSFALLNYIGILDTNLQMYHAIGAWIAIGLVCVCATNFLGVRVYGEMEFWFSMIKVIAIIGLILMGIVLDAGGGPSGDAIGFRYWRK